MAVVSFIAYGGLDGAAGVSYGLIHGEQGSSSFSQVGVNIVERQARNGTRDVAKRDHDRTSTSSLRTSVIRPVSAAAAAMAGLIKWVRAPGP